MVQPLAVKPRKYEKQCTEAIQKVFKLGTNIYITGQDATTNAEESKGSSTLRRRKSPRNAKVGEKAVEPYEEMLSVLDKEISFFESQETTIRKDLTVLETQESKLGGKARTTLDGA